MLTKNIDWSYEREWRMIMPLENASSVVSNDFYLYKFPPASIKEIIIGLRTSESVKEKILDLIQKNTDFRHIKILQAEINNDYSIRLIDINLQ